MGLAAIRVQVMAAKSLTHEELQDVLDLVEKYGSVSEASRYSDLKRSTFESRYQRARDILEDPATKETVEQEVSLPTFPDPDVDIDVILDHLSKRFNKKAEHEKAKHWFKIKIPTRFYGLVVIGDPHLGVHCRIDLLRRDISLLQKTKNVGAVQIGDVTNNWSGRLISLYSEEDISRHTERRLARWFLKEAGIPWVAWLHGNHDQMNSEFSTYLETINAAQIPMTDWAAKFKLVFQNDVEVKIDASHNHKGTSIYNKLQGQKRASLWGEEADIYVAGHHHTWAISQEEQNGRVINLARARGYKGNDDFALRHQFSEENYGASIMFVIDSEAAPNVRVKPFADIEEGCEFLTWKQNRA